MQYVTEIVGKKTEIWVLEFVNQDAFTSINSNRGISPEIQHTGYLNSNDGSGASGSFGQMTIIVFVISLVLGVLSSFGGNSMEMLWNLTNSLQLMYFLSKIDVQYPADVTNFFYYLKFTNANNAYLSKVSYFVISDHHYTRGSVNDKIDEKSFYLSASDKLPFLFSFILLFLFIKLIDMFKSSNDRRRLLFLKRLLGKFKYDFFIRFAIEICLELFFNCVVNMYFYDFSNIYEIYSVSLAIFFSLLLATIVVICTLFLAKHHHEINISKGDLEQFSCLYDEMDRTKPAAIYYYFTFFLRRMIF